MTTQQQRTRSAAPQRAAEPHRVERGLLGRCYKRLTARLLAMESAAYNTAVAGRKRALLGSLAGDVLEIGPGSGANIPFFEPGRVRWIGVEPNPYAHDDARARAEAAGLAIDLRVGTADRLPVADASLDAVVSTLVLCSVPDQDAALAEIRRALKPGGRFAFVEHVRDSHGGRRARLQRIARPVSRVLADGCHPDRETWRAIERAGFSRVELEHFEAPVALMAPHIAGVAIR